MDAIVAVYTDWGIGANGTQPLVVPEDRKRFAALTQGAAVIVGRRTLADFPGGRPLKNRVNILLTRQGDAPEGVIAVHTPEEALAVAADYERVFVLGGATVFIALFPHLDRIFVTKIDALPHSDAYFPNLDALPDWRCIEESPFVSAGAACSFCTYARKPE